MKVLIASCIRQDPDILTEFLQGLDELEKPFEYEYYFIINDLSEESTRIFYDWSNKQDKLTVKVRNYGVEYVKDDNTTHIWTRNLIDNVIEMKNQILEKGRERDVDYLFFTDSDQYYHPKTLTHLISCDKDIIGEISWARWVLEEPEMPNAWMAHPYEFFDDDLLKLRTEELVKVAGFGGCYLISKNALQSGVTFNRIDALPSWGEDRFFHIHAKHLGFSSYIDTKYPYFHIYRKTDLLRLKDWKKNGYKFQERSYEVRKGTVLIGICVGELEIHPDLTAWLIKTFQQHPEWGLEISRMHPIDSNRNHVAKKFMTLPQAQKYEYLLFIDTDVVPPIGAVDRLLNHDKKVIGGLCFIMSNEGLPIPNISKEMKRGYYQPKLTEVKGMGTGFILIHRDVLRDVGKSPFRFQYDEWGIASIAGEDYDFCAKAVNAGYKIYVDFGIQCEHYKQVGLKSLNNQLSRIVNEVNQRERRSTRPIDDSSRGGVSDRG